jgi:hypothetical protein
VTQLTGCPIPGCVTRTNARAMRAHAKVPHVRCVCAWVGVNFAQHRAQRIRAHRDSDGAEAAAAQRRAHRIVEEVRA